MLINVQEYVGKKWEMEEAVEKIIIDDEGGWWPSVQYPYKANCTADEVQTLLQPGEEVWIRVKVWGLEDDVSERNVVVQWG